MTLDKQNVEELVEIITREVLAALEDKGLPKSHTGW